MASTGRAWKPSEPIIQNWWRQGMMGGAKAHYDGIVAFSQTDFTEDLKKITVPVLVMHGDDDQIVPYADSAPKAARLAATESREQLRQRIDQAKVEVDQKATDAQQDASAAAASARSKWAQMKADAAAKMDDLQARIDKRADQVDANLAADDAAWAEDDAAAAIDYAAWTVDNARLAVLDAIDARVYADELANKAGASRSRPAASSSSRTWPSRAATMVETVAPTLSGSAQGQFAARLAGPSLPLPDVTGLAPWLLARAEGGRPGRGLDAGRGPAGPETG